MSFSLFYSEAFSSFPSKLTISLNKKKKILNPLQILATKYTFYMCVDSSENSRGQSLSTNLISPEKKPKKLPVPALDQDF